MICPSCISGGIGAGYIMAFVVCGLFFVTAAAVLIWASNKGHLENLEDTKFKMLQEDDG